MTEAIVVILLCVTAMLSAFIAGICYGYHQTIKQLKKRERSWAEPFI